VIILEILIKPFILILDKLTVLQESFIVIVTKYITNAKGII